MLLNIPHPPSHILLMENLLLKKKYYKQWLYWIFVWNAMSCNSHFLSVEQTANIWSMVKIISAMLSFSSRLLHKTPPCCIFILYESSPCGRVTLSLMQCCYNLGRCYVPVGTLTRWPVHKITTPIICQNQCTVILRIFSSDDLIGRSQKFQPPRFLPKYPRFLTNIRFWYFPLNIWKVYE